MQVWVISLIAVVVPGVMGTAILVLRRKRARPLTRESTLRELRHARRESHFASRFDPSATQCPVNGNAVSGGGSTGY